MCASHVEVVAPGQVSGVVPLPPSGSCLSCGHKGPFQAALLRFPPRPQDVGLCPICHQAASRAVSRLA
jgi:hypothetical protein